MTPGRGKFSRQLEQMIFEVNQERKEKGRSFRNFSGKKISHVSNKLS